MRCCWQRPDGGDAWIMGVLNCTPDSFSDGGLFFDSDAAVAHGIAMWEAGAAIIDVGGESTRPGSQPVPQAEELARVVPVVRALVAYGCTVSIDTMKAEVMRQAIAAGATLVNDVSALGFDGDSRCVVAETGVDVCLMHMQGRPETMQADPQYGDVAAEVADVFAHRIDQCLAAGINIGSIILDPGIGFGKRLDDNLALIRSLPQLRERFGLPLLLGLSRKSFLGALTGAQIGERELETAVAGAMAIAYGADILRVHDVALQQRAVRTASALSPAL